MFVQVRFCQQMNLCWIEKYVLDLGGFQKCAQFYRLVWEPHHTPWLTFMEEEIKTCGSPGLLSSSLGVCLSRWPTGHAVCAQFPVACCLLACTPPTLCPPMLPCPLHTCQQTSSARLPSLTLFTLLTLELEIIWNIQVKLFQVTLPHFPPKPSRGNCEASSEPWIPPGQSDNFWCSDPPLQYYEGEDLTLPGPKSSWCLWGAN